MAELAISQPARSANVIVHWVTTGLIALVMVAGGLAMLFWPVNIEAVRQLGFPGWFHVELGIGKLLGGLALVLPRVPSRIKEWAYVGVGIVLISASLAHFNSGDPVWRASEPLVLLLVLAVSRTTWQKQ